MKRIPTLTDRGHGIGRHSYNDSLMDFAAGKFAPVRQIIVSDVFGESTLRYDLDTRVVTTLATREVVAAPRWSWAQVEEVVTRDLARFGRTWGDVYGTVERTTLYGLYDGKRPSWMSKGEWERRRATAEGLVP